jgi:hypothetical protein
VSRSDTPENRIKAEVLKYLKLRRIKAWSNPSGAVRIRPGKFMSFGLKGSSDILGVLTGGRYLADIKALGGLAVVAKSYRDIETALMEAGYTGIVAGPLFEAPRPGLIDKSRGEV